MATTTYVRRRRAPVRRYVRRRKALPMRKPAVSRLAVARKVNIRRDMHFHTRYCAIDTTTLSTVASSVSAFFTWKLSDVLNYSEFTALYDSYRIMGVLMTFRLINNPDAGNYINSTAAVATNATNIYPNLWYIEDRDDSTAPTLATMKERSAVRKRVIYPNRDIKVFIRYPEPLINTATGAGNMPAPPRMLNTQNVDTIHYGLKVCLDMLGYASVTQNYVVAVEKKYYFAFKNTK